ncbi:hypothetical protein M758_9G136200 [Ceratodon purpureus]|nr:hypothetical protein M758_9G136200 [Ceratodon purpureus]
MEALNSFLFFHLFSACGISGVLNLCPPVVLELIALVGKGCWKWTQFIDFVAQHCIRCWALQPNELYPWFREFIEQYVRRILNALFCLEHILRRCVSKVPVAL